MGILETSLVSSTPKGSCRSGNKKLSLSKHLPADPAQRMLAAGWAALRAMGPMGAPRASLQQLRGLRGGQLNSGRVQSKESQVAPGQTIRCLTHQGSSTQGDSRRSSHGSGRPRCPNGVENPSREDSGNWLQRLHPSWAACSAEGLGLGRGNCARENFVKNTTCSKVLPPVTVQENQI